MQRNSSWIFPCFSLAFLFLESSGVFLISPPKVFFVIVPAFTSRISLYFKIFLPIYSTNSFRNFLGIFCVPTKVPMTKSQELFRLLFFRNSARFVLNLFGNYLRSFSRFSLCDNFENHSGTWFRNLFNNFFGNATSIRNG